MGTWPKNPLLYEINTWVWLDELSRREGRALALGSVPAGEWDHIAGLGFDAVWLMGVWERSPEGRRISMANPGLLDDFHRALPDFADQDNVGSPYCVRRYVVDPHLGGPEGLATAKRELARRGLRLILDFVPNHVAPDHPWVDEHPAYFIRGDEADLRTDPGSFVALGGGVFACGRDPYFPAWPDVLQLNAFDGGLRAAVTETLLDIAGQCDGVRCDMAMLLLNDIFARTWGGRAGARPQTDYWTEIVPAVRGQHPDFLFIAEVYWDLEWELQQQGFDYCYDKRLYDRLEHDPAEKVRLHLCAEFAYQKRLLRFIENHDEPRAAAAFAYERHRAVAVTVATLPGAGLIHEGQLVGRRVRLPVFLARRPGESPDPGLLAFYGRLLEVLRGTGLRQGSWRLCERSGWEGNDNHQNLVAWCWRRESSRHLIVVNLSAASAQARVKAPWDDLRGRPWRLRDLFTNAVYERDGDELDREGLYVDLPAWEWHFLEWQ